MAFFPVLPCNLKNKAQEKSRVLKHGFINFITAYLDLAYYMCICPFRIIPNTDDKSKTPFFLSSFVPQKIICSIFSFLAVFWQMRITWFELINIKDLNVPGIYFEMAFHIVNISHKLWVFQQFWLNPGKFLAVINYIADEKNLMATSFSKITKFRVMCVYFPFVLFLCVTTSLTERGGGGFTRISEWNFQRWWDSVGCFSAEVFLFQSESLPCLNATTENTMVTLIGVAGLVQR